jgi:hypothetical protein
MQVPALPRPGAECPGLIEVVESAYSVETDRRLIADPTSPREGVAARFRFYEELNDFLAPALRSRDIDYRCARAATVKNAIEALGVPHTEVELILVNGTSVDFSYLVREGDGVSVYPKFESFDIRPLLRVRETPLRELRFVADAHLGGLARLLRMLGFDTLYSNQITDEQIRDLASSEARIVLTRDRELLKRREITHGCFVRALKPRFQLREIVQRLQLDSCFDDFDDRVEGARYPQPFTLCLHCNWPLSPVDKQTVIERLPEKVAARYESFSTCTRCERVFWEGSHWARMRSLLAEHLPDAPD